MDLLYGALLRLLPRGYERSEIRETYRMRVARARADRGALGAARERVAELVDLIATLVSARWPLPSLDSVTQDVRTGVRALGRRPLASSLAILSLAIGIGATTAIYGTVDVWLFKPLPLPNADRLVSLWRADAEGRGLSALSALDYRELAEASRSIEPMVYAPTGYNLAVDGRTERIRGLVVSANALDVLGIRPVLGRGFAPQEGTEAGRRVALVSEEFWRSAFGGDRGVVGSTVVLDDVPHTVVGVVPAGQAIPGAVGDVWMPLRTSAGDSRGANYLRGAALLPPGMALEAARAEMDAVAASIAARGVETLFPRLSIQPLRAELYDPQTRLGSRMILLAALFVLLIACANIANILVARGLERRHELAVRGALGAGRGRLTQQLFVEAAIVGVIGGALGILSGRYGMDLLVSHVLPDFIPGRDEIALNGRVLTAAAAMTGASLLLFGLLPAVRAAAPNVRDRLAEGGRGGASRLGRLDSWLMVGEIAATLTLVALTALTLRGFAALRGLDMGMRTTDALVFRVDVPPTSPPDDAGLLRLYGDLDARLAALPGVSEIATSSGHPVSFWSNPTYSIPGRMDEGTIASAELRSVTPSYRSAMQLRMVVGRWFDEATDVADGPPVAVVSEALARRWFDDPADALGATIRHGAESREIVGVIDAGLLRGPGNPSPPAIFEPFSQAPARSTFNVLVHAMDDARAVEAVRAAVREVSPGLAVFGVATIEAEMFEALGPVAAGVQVFGVLALLGLALTLGGVYGVVAQAVGRRRREMGVRMALGARAGEVVRMMVWRSARLATLGIVLGLALSVAGGQVMAAFLYGVPPRDPVVLLGVALALLAVVAAASYLPARGAAVVDPVETLRAE